MRPSVVLAGIALVGSACAGQPAPAPSSAAGCSGSGLVSEGEQLPDCTFEGMPGHPELRLARLRGKPAVINFWASWCTFCIAEMPDFERVHRSMGDRITLVGMNVLGIEGETRTAAATFARRTGVTYPLAFDEGGTLYARFQPLLTRPTLPITVLVDARGTVVDKHFGPYTERELRDVIASRLGLS